MERVGQIKFFIMKKLLVKHGFFMSLLWLLPVRNQQVFAQPKANQVVAGIPVNYDESLVGEYTLPDPLVLKNGKKIKSAAAWQKRGRPQLLKLIEETQFGKVPERPAGMWFKVFEKAGQAFGGRAIRRQVTIYFTPDTNNYKIDLLLYLPANRPAPVPVWLNISFSANSSLLPDPAIKPGMIWREGKKIPAPPPASIPTHIEKILDAGMAFATLYYGDIEPDFKTGIQHGIRGLYLKPGEEQPHKDGWGAIAAWSWGLSRVMDYLETDADIDAKKVTLNGASRLGKTVLWTGARDTRFAAVIASISGEGGAAISRRNYGETIAHITDTSRYHYQFAAIYHSYGKRVSELPFDAHSLVALMAPRPLLLQTGDSDYWSDPKGEFLAALAAAPVYELFGKKGPRVKEWPAAGDQSCLEVLGYYMHHGGHTILPDDYSVFLSFIEKNGLKERRVKKKTR